jgi:hypothetical protein
MALVGVLSRLAATQLPFWSAEAGDKIRNEGHLGAMLLHIDIVAVLLLAWPPDLQMSLAWPQFWRDGLCMAALVTLPQCGMPC